MLDGVKPYTAMKATGLSWIQSIPAHWEIRRNGRLFAQRNETGYPDLPILEVSLRTGVRVRDFDNSVRKQIMSDKEKYKRARAGDIAYNMMRMWQGAVGVSPVDGLVSPAYVVANPFPETHPRFYEYLFRTDAYMNEVNKFSRGIVSDRNRLYWEDFKQIPSPFPPPEEQAAIVRFLDYIDRRVKRYIRAKRKLIALLNEQKQAIIHRAVTRGLDPNVPLKPSGVPWLGDVPQHWEVVKIRRVARINPSRTEALQLRGVDEPVVFLPMERVSTSGEVDSSERRAIKDVWQGFTYFRRGDVVVAKITPCFENGKGACLNTLPTELGFGTTEFIVLRPSARILAEFLHRLTQLAHFRRLGVESMSGAAGQQRVSPEFVENFIVPIPSIDDQGAIEIFIANETKRIAEAIANVQHQIHLLRELQAQLVAEVVTGKLDVREAAAAHPDELESVDSNAVELLDDDEAMAAEENAELSESDDAAISADED